MRNNAVVLIARLRIRPDRLADFIEAVKEELAAAVRDEPGALLMYSVADGDDPCALTFFEVYADDDARRRHVETPHFRKYAELTRDWVISREHRIGAPVTLQDKRGSPIG